MKAYVFPGQGSQFIGMGKDLYQNSSLAKDLFDQANKLLGFEITDIMFNGTDDQLKQTKVTQPAIFLLSVITSKVYESNFTPAMTAGHSLGEMSAIVASGAISFEEGVVLVSKRAQAMQKACEANPSTMAAILGLDDSIVESVCKQITDTIVVPANYNSPGQIVISGTLEGIDKACQLLTQAGAKRALKLPVSGAFHSPLMESARKELEQAINSVTIKNPMCPIYQNVGATASRTGEEIKKNLIAQLTGSVKWTQSITNMIQDGATSFTEVGPGNVLQGLIKKINKDIPVDSLK